VTRVTVGEHPLRREDVLAVEEPLEVRLGGSAYVVTMRTPGHDLQLALGYLVSEGVVTRHEHVAGAILCASDGAPNTYNVLDVTLAPDVVVPEPRRAAPMTSACVPFGSRTLRRVPTCPVSAGLLNPMMSVAGTVATVSPSRSAAFAHPLPRVRAMS